MRYDTIIFSPTIHFCHHSFFCGDLVVFFVSRVVFVFLVGKLINSLWLMEFFFVEIKKMNERDICWESKGGIDCVVCGLSQEHTGGIRFRSPSHRAHSLITISWSEPMDRVFEVWQAHNCSPIVVYAFIVYSGACWLVFFLLKTQASQSPWGSKLQITVNIEHHLASMMSNAVMAKSKKWRQTYTTTNPVVFVTNWRVWWAHGLSPSLSPPSPPIWFISLFLFYFVLDLLVDGGDSGIVD